jgi:hypothetical protein
MTWYGASIITAIEVLDGQQDCVPVEEEVYLLEANSTQEAFDLADHYGQLCEAAGAEGVRWCQRPAKVKFLGVRKIRSIYPPSESRTSVEAAVPVSGAEITHNFFEVADMDTAIRLSKGERVDVSYVDDAD